jgi:hypothetical protein
MIFATHCDHVQTGGSDNGTSICWPRGDGIDGKLSALRVVRLTGGEVFAVPNSGNADRRVNSIYSNQGLYSYLFVFSPLGWVLFSNVLLAEAMSEGGTGSDAAAASKSPARFALLP